MTKSLSNLYKQRQILANSSGARIINSNDRIDAQLQELAKMMVQVPEDGFVGGLQAEQVEVAPPEETVSPEELLQQAQEEADSVLEAARQQAEAIQAEARQQAEAIREQARQEGHNTGFSEGTAKADAALAEGQRRLEEQRQALEADYRQKTEELEPYLVDIIADVFEKVFHVQFDDKKEILLYLIQKVILHAEGTKEFQVRVSRKDYAFVEEHKGEITEQVGGAVKVEIIADAALQERQCMIETDSGIFDCGTDLQLGNIIKALRSLSL